MSFLDFHPARTSTPSSSAKITSAPNVATLTWQFFTFSIYDTGTCFASPKFYDPFNKVDIYQLHLYPRHELAPSLVDQTLIRLYRTSFEGNQTVRFRISILNLDGDECFTQESEVRFNGHYAMTGSTYNLSRAFILDPANGLLVNDNLTIYCEVELVNQEAYPKNRHISITPISETHFLNNNTDVKLEQLSEDFRCLLSGSKMVDITLRVAGKELGVHKLILSARSPVFAAMFEHETKEKKDSVVEITDLPVDVCQHLLRYIYTGHVTDLDRYAADLMIAADKYQLDSLKSTCENYLSSHLTIDSVARVLLLADMLTVVELKAKAMDFIAEHVTEVRATEGWKSLIDSGVELVDQLLQHVACRHNV